MITKRNFKPASSRQHHMRRFYGTALLFLSVVQQHYAENKPVPKTHANNIFVISPPTLTRTLDVSVPFIMVDTCLAILSVWTNFFYRGLASGWILPLLSRGVSQPSFGAISSVTARTITDCSLCFSRLVYSQNLNVFLIPFESWLQNFFRKKQYWEYQLLFPAIRNRPHQ